uniref:Glycine cleavage system H protein n=1 Tax=Heliothis virescens TaxID=7102 RepID=A0A2A4K1Z9_HELVI
MKMAFQRCFLQLSKQYVSKSLYQPAIRQTCCQMYHNYSTENPRKFSDRHEWVLVDNDIGTVGISKYAQESLGDVVFAQLPEPDTAVQEGEECGALESVKAASEIYSPVSGTITEKNTEVESKPGLINTSYYDKGWLFKVKMTNPQELNALMTEEQYEKFLRTDVDKDDKDKEKEKETDT